MAPSAIPPVTELSDRPAVSAEKISESDGTKVPEVGFRNDPNTSPPKFEDPYAERKYLKHRLAIAYRILAKHDLSETVAGHITLRDPVDPESFWVNPFGMHFSLIRDEDLIRVNHDGQVVDGGRNRLLNQAAYAIHAAIHKARPDVICAVHSHTIYGRAFSATGRPLLMLTQDFCTFHDDIVLYPNFAGLVLAAEEGRRIAAALGPRKAAVLGNHGLLTVGQTVEAAVVYFVMLEKLCQVQLAAEAAAGGAGEKLIVIGKEEAAVTYESIGRAENGYFMGLPLFQVGEREFGESTFWGRGLEPL
ncbi:class 2 aldolase adducin domain-containing protein [Podospora appendiculata]|uniref:Class 2 aldolase adducin domain-containing protein n=1 Tax=Podospora appendiculata TaxID=314037 RepID=A0AAE0X575_9PEZI|nr:class 2 aldolase adducin domain-containing protein [Podospora appendiculata]